MHGENPDETNEDMAHAYKLAALLYLELALKHT